MRVLLIEDEPRLAESLRRGLAEHGFVVEVAHDGVDGLHLAREATFELLLLDVGLPGLDGLDVLHALRRSSDLPVLMLSARDRLEDRVKALQDGADDYLVKPFAFSELLVRMQVLLRRRAGERAWPAAAMAIADLVLDERQRRATRRGVRLELTAKEFNLLALLLRRKGQVLSRTVIAEEVWDMNFESDSNAIEVAVRRLRRKLDAPFERKLLHTVRGMGYVLEEREP